MILFIYVDMYMCSYKKCTKLLKSKRHAHNKLPSKLAVITRLLVMKTYKLEQRNWQQMNCMKWHILIGHIYMFGVLYQSCTEISPNNHPTKQWVSITLQMRVVGCWKYARGPPVSWAVVEAHLALRLLGTTCTVSLLTESSSCNLGVNASSKVSCG